MREDTIMKNYLSFVLVAAIMSGGVGTLTSCDSYERTDVTEEIYVDQSEVSLFVGDSLQLTASPLERDIRWESGDESVATVSHGLVIGHHAGTTTVTATDGAATFSVAVTVKDEIKLTDVTPSVSLLDMDPGSRSLITVTPVPSDANNVDRDDCAWWSDDESIARVEMSGTVYSMQKEGGTMLHYRRGTIIKNIPVYVSSTHPFPTQHILSRDQPLTLKFIDFDLGGKNKAWYDTTAGNRGGGTYRSGYGDTGSADVDIINRRYIGYTASGEWLTYTIDVADAGNYRVDTSLGAVMDGLFHIEIDGADVTGPIVAVASGGNTTFAYTTSTVLNLTAGRHKLRFVMDKATYNLLNMLFTATD